MGSNPTPSAILRGKITGSPPLPHRAAPIRAPSCADVTQESLREQLAWKQFLVAEDDGELVAVGALADFGTPGSRRYSVSQFYVRADRHGRGIGRQLLAHVVLLAEGAGVDLLHVPSSRNAVGFYEHCGFTVDGGQPDSADEITWMTKLL